MKPKLIIGLLTVAAVVAWAGIAGAQAAAATPKVQMPSGETVWDLSGDWDAFVENYGAFARYGIYPNVFRMTQTGNTLKGIRVKDNPSPSSGRAGSPSLRGELEKTGFKQVWLVDSGGPMETASGCADVLEMSTRVAMLGIRSASSDVGVAVLLAETGFKGAVMNVNIDLEGISDASFATNARRKLVKDEKRATDRAREALSRLKGIG